jgi:hypothetical protein
MLIPDDLFKFVYQFFPCFAKRSNIVDLPQILASYLLSTEGPLSTDKMLFSVPLNFASRFLLSRAIEASKPSRTKEVFSLMPVSRDAFSNILSSMLSVALICINVH